MTRPLRTDTWDLPPSLSPLYLRLPLATRPLQGSCPHSNSPVLCLPKPPCAQGDRNAESSGKAVKHSHLNRTEAWRGRRGISLSPERGELSSPRGQDWGPTGRTLGPQHLAHQAREEKNPTPLPSADGQRGRGLRPGPDGAHGTGPQPRAEGHRRTRPHVLWPHPSPSPRATWGVARCPCPPAAETAARGETPGSTAEAQGPTSSSRHPPDVAGSSLCHEQSQRG